MFTAKLSRKHREFPYTPIPTCERPRPLRASAAELCIWCNNTHPLTLLSPRVHSSYQGSPRCCTFLVGNLCKRHVPIAIVSFRILSLPKSLLDFCSSFPSLQTPGNCCTFYCIHTIALSKVSHSWHHTVCGLFRLASFT